MKKFLDQQSNFKNAGPIIKKASKIFGRNLLLTDVNVNDAEFILSLRTDVVKSKHISFVDNDIQKQNVWLNDYASFNNQAYFIVNTNQGEKIGTVRIYDAKASSFCWGSWVLKDGAPQYAAIESALIVYSYAIDHLGFDASHFDVRKSNENVWRFHERFGAIKTGETEFDYIYTINNIAIREAQIKYKKFLPQKIKVEN